MLTIRRVLLILTVAGHLACSSDPAAKLPTGPGSDADADATDAMVDPDVGPDAGDVRDVAVSDQGDDMASMMDADDLGADATADVGVDLGEPDLAPPDMAPDLSPNSPPVALDDSYVIAEDATLNVVAANGVLANDADPELDPLSASVETPPVNGSLTLRANGSFDYSPNANFNGSDQFSYRVTDGAATSAPALVTLTVTPVNDAPAARQDSYVTFEGTSFAEAAPGVLANDTDVDQDPLTAGPVVTQPANGTVVLSPDGSFSYTPAVNFAGTDSFQYSVTDGALSATGTVLLDVREVHDVAWARAAGAFGNDGAFGADRRADGSVVVVGGLHGASSGVVFGAGETNQTTVMGVAFAAAYAANGLLLWASGVSASSFSSLGAVSTFVDGSSVVAGRAYGDATFGAGEPNETTVMSTIGSSGWIVVGRYNADGTLAWATGAPSYNGATARDVAALPDGTSVVVGICSAGTIFGHNELAETTIPDSGMCLAKLNSDGTLAWAKGLGGEGLGAVVALGDGSFVVSGNFFGTVTLGVGEPNETTFVRGNAWNILVARYAADGTLMWATDAFGTIPSSSASGLAVLGDGTIIATGTWWGSATFGEGTPTQTTITASSISTFLARYNPDGSLLSAVNGIGAAAVDVFADDTLFVWVDSQTIRRQTIAGVPIWTIRVSDASFSDIVVSSDGAPIAVGSFSTPATFGEGSASPITLTPVHSADLFVVRYLP